MSDTHHDWVSLQLQLESFVKRLETGLVEIGIYETTQQLTIDHICVRLKDVSSIDSLKRELQSAGDIISAINVNGRQIVIFQLANPLYLGSKWTTYGLELPYPKHNHNYEDGWEHVEFVLAGAENTLEGIRTTFFNTFPNLDSNLLRERYAYSEDEPHADGDQLPNPTIGIKVNGIGIKFHAYSIQKVVGFAL